VGIDYYPDIGHLQGCANDARAVHEAIAHHGDADREINFLAPELLVATDEATAITTRRLKDSVRALFANDSETAEIALFYFAGHGYVEDTGGFLCASNSESGDDGLPLSDVMTFANTSNATHKVVMLDSCHSGAAGARPTETTMVELADGVTILTASTAEQRAFEENGSGLFTGLLVDALNGAAANLVGDVTPGGVYAHIDQALAWGQRPVFKTNVKRFVSLRKTLPPIDIGDLRELARHFPEPEHQIQLDPAYEPERSAGEADDPSIPPPDPDKTKVFAVLQSYERVNLLRPVGTKHMWHAAMQRKPCELTALGRHYWYLVRKGLI
jgi:hypothetical protein